MQHRDASPVRKWTNVSPLTIYFSKDGKYWFHATQMSKVSRKTKCLTFTCPLLAIVEGKYVEYSIDENTINYTFDKVEFLRFESCAFSNFDCISNFPNLKELHFYCKSPIPHQLKNLPKLEEFRCTGWPSIPLIFRIKSLVLKDGMECPSGIANVQLAKDVENELNRLERFICYMRISLDCSAVIMNSIILVNRFNYYSGAEFWT